MLLFLCGVLSSGAVGPDVGATKGLWDIVSRRFAKKERLLMYVRAYVYIYM